MTKPTHIKEILKDKTLILDGADKATSRGFTQVPNFVLESEEVSTGAKLAYAMLLKYAWHENRCFPGQDKLAAEMGVSRRSVNNYIQELKEKGYISIERQGQGKTNIYTLHLTVDSQRGRKS